MTEKAKDSEEASEDEWIDVLIPLNNGCFRSIRIKRKDWDSLKNA